MIVQWLLASLHLLALGIGLGAIWIRARSLTGQVSADKLHRAFLADTFWGAAAILWIATGLWRAFGGVEKGTTYYLDNDAFIIKMILLILILILEVWPMITLIKWRIAMRRGGAVDLTPAHKIAAISRVQVGLVILMVFAATAMARGYAKQLW